MTQVYDKAVERLPAIIAEAAKSTLGLLALMVILLSALAFVFFRNAGERVRTSVFAAMLAGVVAFGVVATKTGRAGTEVAPKEVTPNESRPPGIAGTVVDQQTNHSIPQARISVVGGRETGTSDDTGNFSLSFAGGVQSVRLHVEKAGYHPADLSVAAPAQSLIIQLKKD